MGQDFNGVYIPDVPGYNSGYEDGRKSAKAQIEDLTKALAAEKERADYAWKNTHTIEKSRQDEMFKCEALKVKNKELRALLIRWAEDVTAALGE